jgi:hypothetical protein
VTTYVPLSPPPGQGFDFQATLDGNTYRMRVTWNVFGQRWFLSCFTANDVLVFHQALVSSPQEGDINLLAGYFITSTLVFRALGSQFEVNP